MKIEKIGRFEVCMISIKNEAPRPPKVAAGSASLSSMRSRSGAGRERTTSLPG